MHGNQTLQIFDLCLDDISGKGWTDPEALHAEEHTYLKDFHVHNGNVIQPLSADELLDILEYGVPAKWRREFTVQGFDPVDQGLQKFVKFCTCLELCEPSKGKPKGEKPSKPKTARKHKAKVSTTPTITPAGKRKFYCEMHWHNRTCDTEDCFELKWRAKCTKPNMNCAKVDKVSYKDLNAVVNAKVTAALNKAKKNLKNQKKQKEVELNAFDKFCSLNFESSDEEDKPNEHAPTAADNDNSPRPVSLVAIMTATLSEWQAMT
eukprot:15365622-Ditylum_brightwellii.AAC.1